MPGTLAPPPVEFVVEVVDVALGLIVLVTTLSPTFKPLVISVSVLLAKPVCTVTWVGVVPLFNT